jgi:hypothetical protein
MLIPDRPDFVPRPGQVAAFYEVLAGLESVPLDAKFQLSRLTGESQTFSPPGMKPLTIPKRKSTFFESISQIPEQLNGLNEYRLGMWGKGPARRPPFAVYGFLNKSTVEHEFTGEYGYQVTCDLDETVVETIGQNAGKPCPPERRAAVFQNPRTNAKIEVPNSACARFWIRFVVGKFLWPKIEDSFKLLNPSIMAVAIEQFGIGFAEGGLYT